MENDPTSGNRESTPHRWKMILLDPTDGKCHNDSYKPERKYKMTDTNKEDTKYIDNPPTIDLEKLLRDRLKSDGISEEWMKDHLEVIV
tara:strand:- start:1262 stop:1525 length:264 start_codon:yes stop_codon:yes gene_type:complete